jgi:putative transposase
MLGIGVDITLSGFPSTVGDVLVGEVAEYTREVLSEILRELECEPLAIEVMPDHVHVFALCPPRHSPAYIVNYLKGKSARRILQRFPELKSKAISWEAVE